MKIIAGAHAPVTNSEVLQWLREKTSVWSNDTAFDDNDDDHRSNHKSKPSGVREGFIAPSRNTRDIMNGVRAYIESSPAGKLPLCDNPKWFYVIRLLFRFRQEPCEIC